MPPEITFQPGAYNGDDIEELFKPLTSLRMEYWWHFREVLVPGLSKTHPFWKRIDGQPLSDEEYSELIALSLINYSVYTNIVDAVLCEEELSYEIHRREFLESRVLRARKLWKALYSSLYSGFNSLSNIVCIVVDLKPPFEVKKSGLVWNHSPQKAIEAARAKNLNSMEAMLVECRDNLEIRDHLDHYWTIWTQVDRGYFRIDGDFEKARIPLDPSTINYSIDALQRARDHIGKCFENFNLIYKDLSITGGFLDQYFAARGWFVDYSNAPAHNNQRPQP